MMIRGPELLGPEAFPFAPQLKLGDIFFAFRGESKMLEIDAKKAGDRAGQTIGQRIKKQLSAANIGTAVGAGIGAVGVAALKMGEAYDKALDTIRIGTGATGDALADLEKSFKNVAGDVPDDIGLISEVLADLNTRTGQTGDGLETLTKQILDLSRLTGTDAPKNVASLTRLYGDWTVATEDQAEANDFLFRASQATGVSIDKLSESMVQFGAPLRSIGFDMEEAATLLAKWEKEGVNTTLALGGLKIATGKMAKEGVIAKEGFADLVAEIMRLGEGTEATALGVKAFGSIAANDMVEAILAGRFEIQGMTEDFKTGEETITAATEATQGFGEGFKKLKNRVAVLVGPITDDLAGIADTMGNAIFLLPALTAGLGRALGKAAGSGVARRAAVAAGGAIGVVFRGAMFIGSKFVAAAIALWGLIGGSRVVAAAGVAGAKAGAAYAGAAAGGGFLGTAVKLLAGASVVALPVVAANLAIEAAAPRKTDFAGPKTTQFAANTGIDKAIGIQGVLRDALGTRQPSGSEIVAEMLGLTDPAQSAAVVTDAMRAAIVTGTSGALSAAGPEVAVAGEVIGENVGRGVGTGILATSGSVGEAITTLAGRVGDVLAMSADEAITQMNRLADAMAMVAARGVKGLRAQEKDADEAWKNIIGAGDRNKRRLREVREDIGKWERRLRRAIRNNDSEAAAFATAQLDRLTAERESRRLVVQQVKAQNRALKNLPEKTRTKVVMDFVQRGFTGGGKTSERADGGPVSKGQPYIVGERGRELFIPERSGKIVSNDDVQKLSAGSGGGNTTYNTEVTGLPMQADTPFEVAQQLRRAARFGTPIPRRAQGFGT